MKWLNIAMLVTSSLFVSCVGEDDMQMVLQSSDSPENDMEVTDMNSVNVKEAIRVVSDYSETEDGVSRSLLDKDIDVLTDEAGKPIAYVFNFSKGGFVVVSAVKVLQPIIAYNTVGRFDDTTNGLDNWIATLSDIVDNPLLVKTEIADKNRLLWHLYEASGESSRYMSRDWKPGEIDPAIRQQLFAIYGDSLTS